MGDFDNDSRRWLNKKNVVERWKCKMAKGNAHTHTHAIVLGSFCHIIEPRETEWASTFIPFSKNLALDFVIWVCSCGALSINEYQSLRGYLSLGLTEKRNFVQRHKARAMDGWMDGRRQRMSIDYIVVCIKTTRRLTQIAFEWMDEWTSAQAARALSRLPARPFDRPSKKS